MTWSPNSFPFKKEGGYSNKAFTLVELIITITILAILGTIAFISLQWYSAQSRDSVRLNDLTWIKTSLELYQLEAWKYPDPTSGTWITYSGWLVWTQWTFWIDTFENVKDLDKIPTDPLTGREYTYSVVDKKIEYELWGIMEWSEYTQTIPLSNEANAWEVIANAIVVWNYNGQMAKSLNWVVCSILAVPSIIASDIGTSTDLQEIVDNKRLVYKWYQNLPSSSKWSKFKQDWWFEFTPNNLLSYTDTGSCDALTSKNSYTARIALLKWLQNSYSWTILSKEWEIKNIADLVIDLNTPSNEVINFAWNFVNNTLWWKVIIGDVISSWSGGGWGSGLTWKFVTKWKTNQPGWYLWDYTIRIYLVNGDIYNFNVDWWDWINENISWSNLSNITHTYASIWTYLVSISWTLPALDMGRNDEIWKLLSIEEWWNIVWQDMSYAFAWSWNMNINAPDSPNLSQVTSMIYAFADTDLSISNNIWNWDVSNVTNMDSVFAWTQWFNWNIWSWNTWNVTFMGYMFYDAVVFNKPIWWWDVSSVTNMHAMFHWATVFNQPIWWWDTSAVTSIGSMFFHATAFNQDLTGWDVSNVTNSFFFDEWATSWVLWRPIW